jgi:hypothetical protein
VAVRAQRKKDQDLEQETYLHQVQNSLSIENLETAVKTIAPIFEGKETSTIKTYLTEDLETLKTYGYALGGKVATGNSTYNSMYDSFLKLEQSLSAKKALTPKDQLKIVHSPVKKTGRS